MLPRHVTKVSRNTRCPCGSGLKYQKCGGISAYVMADYGAWNRKGATLSDVSALKEYGVDEDFVIGGIRSGDLEYREGSTWGNPYLRLLRDQLETYIARERGSDYLAHVKAKTELRAIRKERRGLRQRLGELQEREAALQERLTETP
jgi:hypothetical protein